MGCCTSFRQFCRVLKIEHLFREQNELFFIGPDGVTNRWAASSLPAPLHLGPAFLKLSHLTLRQKLIAIRGLRALAKPQRTHHESFADWLERHRQPADVVERFWEVVLVSALSESMDRIDLRYARKVFVDGFMAHRDGWKVTIPTVPLDEIYGGPIQRWLSERTVEVRTRAGAASLAIESERAVAVELRSGEKLEGDQFVLAMPRDRVADLLSEQDREGVLRNASPLETAPISSVHLWFDRPITELPHAVLIGRVSQWMFRRTPLDSERGSHRASVEDQTARSPIASEPVGAPSRPGFYYQVVVSASRTFLEMESAEAIAAVRDELEEIWPQTRDAELLHARVVTEHSAVFSPKPGIDDQRPMQQTSVPNLHLAGDWTATGWPATMEGAVRSGYLAAEGVLRQLGRPARLVAPDQRPSWLAHWLIGQE
jgi:squalene-associated FAD-dependent desaturase